MERIWNIVYYFAYRMDYKLHLAFNHVNPIIYLYKLPFFKHHFEKKGYNPVLSVNEVFENPNTGLSSMFAGILMATLPFYLLFGFHNFYFLIVGGGRLPSYEAFMYPLIGYGAISYLISYILLFRQDKYMAYFKEFDKKPHEWKVKWSWISFGLIMFPFIVLALSFVAMS